MTAWATYLRDYRAAKKARGECRDCTDTAQPGKVRCARHEVKAAWESKTWAERRKARRDAEGKAWR